jgi:hypothetical protein
VIRRYWTPDESFDWSTGGRALSRAEREHLRKLLLEERAHQPVRDATVRPRLRFDQELPTEA